MTRLLDGKSALITGGAQGIGQAAVRAFAREGARIVFVDTNPQTGQTLEAELQETGHEVYFHRADVSAETDVQGMVEHVKQRFGRLDCAFNNAGITPLPAPIDDTPLSQWQHVLAVNLTGVFLGLKYELALMKTQGSGVIVNNASGAGVKGVPTLAAYCASKHGVVGLTKTAAMEVRTLGIRVNAVLPGVIETDTLRKELEHPAHRDLIRDSIPCGRPGTPEEVAQAVLWLCSDHSNYISGACLLIDMAAG